MPSHVTLREVRDDDLPHFFANESDPEAAKMAAFVSRNPGDRAAFDAHWERIRQDEGNIILTITADGEVAGSMMSFVWEGKREVGYWIARRLWGQGIATEALRQFLDVVTERPLHAAAAKDNLGSRRVLEKCGFTVTGEGVGYSEARGEDTEEVYYTLA